MVSIAAVLLVVLLGAALTAPGRRLVRRAASAVRALETERHRSAQVRGQRRQSVVLRCGATAKPISPMIYGVAVARVERSLNPAAFRWGGNPASRYNWQTAAYNTANDWFFENVQAPAWQDVVRDAQAWGAFTALTVPLLGWVAKDNVSVSFPRSLFGEQQDHDSTRPEAGNGLGRDGRALTPRAPSLTSIEADPRFVADWVRRIRAEDQRLGRRRVHSYILDNEPSLWHSTHRDVHPEPVGYGELLERTLRYASAIRDADPDAIIAGPAEWGWPAIFDSARDLELKSVWGRKPDREAHGSWPFLTYYLRELAAYERRHGKVLLDVLDVHFYPQADGVYGQATDPETVRRRLNAPRSLWDAEYVDESWIDEKMRLLPRLHELIAAHYPGRGLSIGEWNMGGEQHISGGLAVAETLGRFAQQGLTSAFYWTAPPADSPAACGFSLYRNFDGQGGRFQDWLTQVEGDPHGSLFASRDRTGSKLVVVLINYDEHNAASVTMDLHGCGRARSVRAFSCFAGGGGAPSAMLAELSGDQLRSTLRPWSGSVFEVMVDAQAQ